MSEIPSDFDFHEYLNTNIKDEFSPMMENIKQTKIVKRRSRDIQLVLAEYFESRERKSVVGS